MKEKIAKSITREYILHPIKKSDEKRPPKWEREELILALDLYFKLTPAQFDESNSSIIELSQLLKKMAEFYSIQKNEIFRNPVGVKSKLFNFLFLDKGKGRSNTGKHDKIIWKEFSTNQEKLKLEAEKIRLGIEEENVAKSQSQSFQLFSDADASEFPEGRVRYFMHKKRERNSIIINRFKKNAEARGKLFCEICGFDFNRTYGIIGKGFIECHHLKPLSEYEQNEKTTKNNLVLVCSNCHKILHKYRPWLGRDKLKDILK